MSIDHDLSPMCRLTERTVRSGLVIAWRLATSPTRISPFFENPTTDGVVRDPSAFGMTTGSPASSTDTTEFVVPRSIPTARAIWFLLLPVAAAGHQGFASRLSKRPALAPRIKVERRIDNFGVRLSVPVAGQSSLEVPLCRRAVAGMQSPHPHQGSWVSGRTRPEGSSTPDLRPKKALVPKVVATSRPRGGKERACKSVHRTYPNGRAR